MNTQACAPGTAENGGPRAKISSGKRGGAPLTFWYVCQPPKEKAMKLNVGGIDRILRIVVGLVLIALAAMGKIGWWGWLGVIPLATGLFRFCPAYTLLGMNTCPNKSTNP
jgi:hypothetical protein